MPSVACDQLFDAWTRARPASSDALSFLYRAFCHLLRLIRLISRSDTDGLMACDFFHVDTTLFRRLYVLVFIHHDTRLVRIAGVTANPVTGWVTQQARNLSMELAEQANAIKFLIRDRDTKFTASFDAVFASDGTRVITTPVRAPRANAICERVIGTIRRECLDRMLILGRRHLEAVLAEYIEHYNAHRPHRSLSQRPPADSDATPPSATLTPPGYEEPIVWGGLIHEYRMVA
jgi:putative transposase